MSKRHTVMLEIVTSFGVIWENLSKVQFVNLCEGVSYILNILNICSNSVNKEKRSFELTLWQSPCLALYLLTFPLAFPIIKVRRYD